MLTFLWFFVGAIGGILFWIFILNEKSIDNPYWIRPRCPTPRALFFMFLGSLFGPLMLGGALFCLSIQYIADYMQQSKPNSSKFKRWWTTPICRNKIDNGL